jgi:hypothetical protein
MIFWTIVFITYYAALLVRGNLYYNVIKVAGELTLKQAITVDKKEKETIGKELAKAGWKMLLAIPLIIAECIYLFSAINVDIYKYPSILMLFYMLFSVFVLNRNSTNKSKYDLKTEQGQVNYQIFLDDMKRYTFKGAITSLIYLGYFGYMFYLLMLR